MTFAHIPFRRSAIIVVLLLIFLGNPMALRSLSVPANPRSPTALRALTLPDGSPATVKTASTLARGTAIRLRPMAAGTNHACAILADDRVVCWGENDWGQLGIPGFVSVPFPVFVSGLAAAPVNLAAGEEHTCALLADGRVQCWGGCGRPVGQWHFLLVSSSFPRFRHRSGG